MCLGFDSYCKNTVVVHSIMFQTIIFSAALVSHTHPVFPGHLSSNSLIFSVFQQCNISDCHKRCHRFSTFLGRLYLEVLTETDSTG